MQPWAVIDNVKLTVPFWQLLKSATAIRLQLFLALCFNLQIVCQSRILIRSVSNLSNLE